MTLRCLVALIVLALAACGSSPKTHFFTLDATPAEGQARHAGNRTPIEVGHVDLPSTLDRQSMVTRGAGNQVNVSDQDRWSGPLDELVQRALTADLRQRLPEGQVFASGDPTPKGTRTLTVNVQRFTADPSNNVVLEADWSLQSSGKSAGPRHESISAPLSGQGGEAVANAMSRALGQLADRVAASS